MTTLIELSQYLKVVHYEGIQDWAIVNADSYRVGEFIKIHQSQIASGEAEENLVELITYSLDKKLTQKAIGRELWSEGELKQDWQNLLCILRSHRGKYDDFIHHVLSGRDFILEEEIEEYYPILLLFEEEFPDSSKK